MKFLNLLKAPFFGILLSLAVCATLLLSIGENPKVLIEAFSNTLLTDFGIGYTLFYATPLILTGLSVALSFHCGLFNIGAEGQLYMGASGLIAASQLLPLQSSWLAIPFGILCAGLSGGSYGAFAGYLKAKRGSHEVIVTIVLNFLGIAFTNYLILYLFKNTEIQNPETLAIGEAFFLKPLSEFFKIFGLNILNTTPVNTTLFLALTASLFCYLFLFHTTAGYEMRAVGQNPVAARFGGISVTRNTLLAFFMSGLLAGLVAVNEIMGYQHKLIEGFSPEYGFTGIAVALMARNHPIGIIFSALLFGALHNSSRELEFISEKVTKELSLVLQATLIAFIAGNYFFEKFYQTAKRKLNV